MPQMSPMSWTLVFILCLASSMFSMAVIHFNSLPNGDNSHSDKALTSSKALLKFNI